MNKGFLLITLVVALAAVASATITTVVAGSFFQASPVQASGLGVFDDSTGRWWPLSQSPPGNVTAAAVNPANNDIYLAVLNPSNSLSFVYLWDQIRYHNLGYSFDGTINHLNIENNVLYAAGSFSVFLRVWNFGDAADQRFDKYASDFAKFDISNTATLRSRWAPVGDYTQTLPSGSPRKYYYANGANFALSTTGSMYWLDTTNVWVDTLAGVNIDPNSQISDVWFFNNVYYAWGGVALTNDVGNAHYIIQSNDGRTWSSRSTNASVVQGLQRGRIIIRDSAIVYATGRPGEAGFLYQISGNNGPDQLLSSGQWSGVPQRLSWLGNDVLVYAPGLDYQRFVARDDLAKYRAPQRFGRTGFVKIPLGGEPLFALGGGVSPVTAVTDFMVTSSLVIAWGNFNQVFNVPAYGLTGYDDSNGWVGLGAPLLDSFNTPYLGGSSTGSIITTAIFDEANSRVYIGGYFPTINNQTYNSLASYNLNNPNGGVFDPIVASAVPFPGVHITDVNQIYDQPGVVTVLRQLEAGLLVAGRFTHAYNVALNNIGIFNASEWYPLNGGVDGLVYDALEIDNYIYVVGSFKQAGGVWSPAVARWNKDSSNWEQVGVGISGTIYTIVHYGGHIVVGGTFTSAGTRVVRNIARLDDEGEDNENWEPFPCDTCISGCKQFNYETCLSSTVYELREVAGAGFFARTDNGVYKWNGDRWTLMTESSTAIAFPGVPGKLLIANSITGNDDTIVIGGVSSNDYFQNNVGIGVFDYDSKNYIPNLNQNAGVERGGVITYIGSASSVQPIVYLIVCFVFLLALF